MSVALVAIVLLINQTAQAAGDWSLMTSDFHMQTVQLRGMDARVVSFVASPSTQPSSIETSTMISLERTGTAPLRPRFLLRLRGGDVLAGEPQAIEGEALRWRETLLGSMTVPMNTVVSLGKPRRDDATAAPARDGTANDDAATLANGDVVHGVVSDLNSKLLTIQRPDNTLVPVPLDSLNDLHFASTAVPTTAPTNAHFQVTLLNGTKLSTSEMSVQLPTLAMVTMDGLQRHVPLESVRRIEQLDGPVAWLSALVPSENVQIPLLDRAQPARFDRSVTGGPLRFRDHIYSRGIGVHAYSRISWPIGASDQSFRTQFAIDGDAPYADVNVRIKLDDRTASETRDVRAGVLSPVISLDVRGSQTLTLEVEDATNGNVQARLNWLEPAMLRFTPTTQP